jgi:hypothetical protein
MRRTNLFLKVEVEHDSEESVERIGGEICRAIAKIYGVRFAEVASVTPSEE